MPQLSFLNEYSECEIVLQALVCLYAVNEGFFKPTLKQTRCQSSKSRNNELISNFRIKIKEVEHVIWGNVRWIFFSKNDIITHDDLILWENVSSYFFENRGDTPGNWR